VQPPAAAKEAPKAIFRKDYKPTPYTIDTVHLNFNLNEDVTTVTSRLAMVPKHSEAKPPPLFLNGRPDVKLVSVSVAGVCLLHAASSPPPAPHPAGQHALAATSAAASQRQRQEQQPCAAANAPAAGAVAATAAGPCPCCKQSQHTQLVYWRPPVGSSSSMN
jgi:hypothetical protein